jgi:hypothetical protein
MSSPTFRAVGSRACTCRRCAAPKVEAEVAAPRSLRESIEQRAADAKADPKERLQKLLRAGLTKIGGQ